MEEVTKLEYSEEDASNLLQDAVEALRDSIDGADDDNYYVQEAVRGVNLYAWTKFCNLVSRNLVQPTCVIDFPYADKRGKLKLEGDNRLLTRMYCFHELQQQQNKTANLERVVLHVHTQVRWGDKDSIPCEERARMVTSVNVRHAKRASTMEKYAQEPYGTRIVPFSQEIRSSWQSMSDISWSWQDEDSLPLDEYEPASECYDLLRPIIALGESLLHGDLQESNYFISRNRFKTEEVLRHGKLVDYECQVVGLFQGSLCLIERPQGLTQTPLSLNQTPTPARLDPLRSPRPTPSQPRVLFVGINVQGQMQIQVEKEYAALQESLQSKLGSTCEERIKTLAIYTSRPDEVMDHIDSFRPTILHLACHGEESGVHLNTFIRSGSLLTGLARSNNARDESERIRMVVANTCLSADIAEELGRDMEFVVGHYDVLRDSDAMRFTHALYAGFAEGRSLQQSFDTAKECSIVGKYTLSKRSNACKMWFLPCSAQAEDDGVGSACLSRACFGLMSQSTGHDAGSETMKRPALMHKLSEWLGKASPHVLVAHGLGGSGKSTLAHAFATEVYTQSNVKANLAESYSKADINVVIFLRADRLAEDYHGLARTLSAVCGPPYTKHTPRSSALGLRDFVHEMLTCISRRWLCVLDDVHDYVRLSEPHGMLHGFPFSHGKTIITSRSDVCARSMDACEKLPVGPFKMMEASMYVCSRMPHWAAADDEVLEFVSALGMFPLAIRHAVEHARTANLSTPQDYLALLHCTDSSPTTSSVTQRSACAEYPQTLVDVVRVSVRALEDSLGARCVRVLQTLALLRPTAIPVQLLRGDDDDDDDVMLLLDALKQRALVSVSPGDVGCVSMHALTQMIVREHLTADNVMLECAHSVARTLYQEMRLFKYQDPATYVVGLRCATHAHSLIMILAGGGTLARDNTTRHTMLALCECTGMYFARLTAQYALAREIFEASYHAYVGPSGAESARDTEEAHMLKNMALVLEKQAEYTDAIERYQQAIDICNAQSDVARAHVRWVDAMVGSKWGLANVLSDLGRLDEALLAYEDVLQLQKTYLASTQEQTDTEGTLHHRTGQISLNHTSPDRDGQNSTDDSTGQTTSQSSEGRGEGTKHADVATTLNCIAIVYRRQGRLTESIERLREVVKLRIDCLGGDHIDVAATLVNLAVALQYSGQLEEARVCNEQALGVMKLIHGHMHRDVATTLMNLGVICYGQHKMDQALEWYNEALRIKLQVLGENHIEIAAIHSNMGLVHEYRGDLSKALSCYEAAHHIQRARLGDALAADSVATYYNMASIYKSMGQLEKARGMFNECVGVYAKLYGDEHPETVDAVQQAQQCMS